MVTRYLAFIVSEQPIPEELMDQIKEFGGIEHLFVDTVDVGTGEFPVIRQAAPEHCGGSQEVFRGTGKGRLAAILSWALNVVSSPSSVYRNKRRS